MKITADTNLLVRGAVLDDLRQVQLAAKELRDADLVAIPVSALCEFVWVLRRGYRRSHSEIAQSLRSLVDSANVVMDRGAVEAGLATLEAGGDFADGAVAHEGMWLGAEEFVSFDKDAVDLLTSQGLRARLLS
ncbi:MAG TPA: type II toxin-antitoxin system VapC family toxin [Terracidiphilus sp.]|nr:type II toxin-antitoxin system VapC family toxin [Terracidiphilus sp.]